MKNLVLAVVSCLCWSAASPAAVPAGLPAPSSLVKADWQPPKDLPRGYRNHCAYARGRDYCAYHCGSGYQFYYCGGRSFGCCRIGFGYCAGDGTLRCAP